MRTLSQISQELRLLAGELRGHDDLDQWIRLERLADEIEAITNPNGGHMTLAEELNEIADRVRLLEDTAKLAEGWHA